MQISSNSVAISSNTLGFFFPPVNVIELGKKIELSRDPIPLLARLSQRAAKPPTKFEVRETLKRAVERRSALAIKLHR